MTDVRKYKIRREGLVVRVTVISNGYHNDKMFDGERPLVAFADVEVRIKNA
jgi:hypothetical protein